MKANFARALPLVLAHEGGFVNHPKDPGGATNKGITLANFKRYVDPNGDVDDLKRITDAEVEDVYYDHYWRAVKGDELPSGVDYAVFDFGVNSGPSRAIKYLQKSVGVEDDGALGPVTLAAVRKMDASVIIDKLCDRRMAFLRALQTWDTFGKGWSARVAGVRKHAHEMAKADPAMSAPTTPETPASESPMARTWLSTIIEFFLAILKGFRK